MSKRSAAFSFIHSIVQLALENSCKQYEMSLKKSKSTDVDSYKKQQRQIISTKLFRCYSVNIVEAKAIEIMLINFDFCILTSNC